MTEKSELLRQLRIERGEPEPRATRSWAVPLALAALGLLGAGVWWMTGTTPRVQTVGAVSVHQADSGPSLLDATGYVVARRQATVSAKITGKISEVLIEEGQRVTAGEVLGRLDDVDARAQLDLAKAQLESSRSQLADLSVQLAQARRDMRRQQELEGRKLTSAQAAEQARSNVASLQSRLASQQRQVSVAEQSLRVAEVNQDNTIVRAPFSGVVVAKTAQPGEIVSPMSAGGGYTRTGIGTIVDMESLEIEVDVNESFIGRVKPGQTVEAILNAYPDWNIPAEVIAIIPTADRSKATVKVRIALLAKDPRIVPEMGVRVAFLGDESKDAKAPKRAGVSIPQSAITRDGDPPVAFVAINGRAQRRVLELGAATGQWQEVGAGIRAGEPVIVSPPAGLKDGDRVKIEDREPGS
jgi:RND family efflux transporter MFP subunit